MVCDCIASVLFDPGPTFSYVSPSFATGLNLHCELLDMPIRVSTPVGESVVVEKGIWVLFGEHCGEQHLCRFGYLRNG